jgi:hypothetical protein
MNGIENFRDLMLIGEGDSTTLAGYKKMTQRLGEIFVKFFSINWIFSSRLNYKDAHLKARFKVLRRIRNPAMCTYFK